MYEAEVKFFDADAGALKRRLTRLGATDLGEVRIARVAYFTPPPGSDYDRTRVRDRNGPQITHKIRIPHRKVKLALEDDLDFEGEYDGALRHVARLGCRRQRMRYDLDKLRQSHELDVPFAFEGRACSEIVRVEFDYLVTPKGAPPIVELERKSDDPVDKSVAALREAARILGLDWRARSRLSTAKAQAMYLKA